MSTNYRLEQGLKYLPENAYSDAHTRERCAIDLYHPADQKGYPTVVYFHGGGITGGARFVPEFLKNHGWAVAAAGYRLHPLVQHPTYIEDTAAAVAFVVKNIARFGGDPSRVVICGASAGAYLTLMVGLDKQYLAAHDIDADTMTALLPLTPQVITHQAVRKEQGVTPYDMRPTIDRFAPLYHIRKNAPPILCTTGDWHLDLLCRAYECAYFIAMLKLMGHPDATHVVIPGVGHNDTVPEFWAPSIQFLKQKFGM